MSLPTLRLSPVPLLPALLFQILLFVTCLEKRLYGVVDITGLFSIAEKGFNANFAETVFFIRCGTVAEIARLGFAGGAVRGTAGLNLDREWLLSDAIDEERRSRQV